MNFRLKPDMYVVAPKVQLAHYVDNTMPRRNWSAFDWPTSRRKFLATRYRTPVSNGETAPKSFTITRQVG